MRAITLFQPLHPDFLFGYNNPAAATAAASGSASGDVNFTPRRSWGIRPHVGTRVDGPHTTQGEDSYFEFGYQYLRQFNLLSEIEFANSGAAPAYCGFSASASISQCPSKMVLVNQSTVVSALYATASQGGFYWDFKYTAKLTKPKTAAGGSAKPGSAPAQGLNLVVDGKGDAFLNKGGYSTQTRIDSTFDVGFTIPSFWQGLSIKPTFSLFYYENQVGHNHVFDRTYNLAVTFNMDRHSRIGLYDALRFGPAGSSGAGSTAGSKQQ